MATNVIELLGLKTENNIYYYRYTRYHSNNVNIKVEIHVNPFERYNIEIYKLDEIDDSSTFNEGVEVSDSDIFIKMIEILENKYKIKIINNKD